MPIYDYACTSCGQITEVIHGIHDAGPRFCPACGAEGAMRKGITTSAVHFKGSGWAKKDRAASSSAGKSRSATPAGDAGKSDAGKGSPGGGDAGKGDAGKGDAGGSGSTSGGATAAAATTSSDGGE